MKKLSLLSWFICLTTDAFGPSLPASIIRKAIGAVTGHASGIEIVPMRQDQAMQAKNIFYTVIHELQLIPCRSLEDVDEYCKDMSEQYDDLQKHYFDNRGIFLVIQRNQAVLGSGAIKLLDEETCEMQRVFFARELRGKGFGDKTVRLLIEKAQELKYKKMRLEVYRPEIQVAAVNLYKKFNFYPIEPYKDSDAQLFMERQL